MIQVNIQDAKANLSKYLNRLAKGERILLCRRNVPVAEIRPLSPPRSSPRPIGVDRRKLVVPAAFFEPLPPELLAAFGDHAAARP